MKNLDNDRGIALVTALLLTVLALSIIMAVLYLITQGIQVSAAHKRYKTVLESSYGGVEVFTKDLLGKAIISPTVEPTNPLLPVSFARYTGCFQKKLNNPTAAWESLGCSATSKSVDAKTAPDARFTLQGAAFQPNFNIYTKIVDTIPGNSDMSGVELLDAGAGVAYGSSGVSPQHVPAMFRIEVQAERETNAQERANLSVLYAY